MSTTNKEVGTPHTPQNAPSPKTKPTNTPSTYRNTERPNTSATKRTHSSSPTGGHNAYTTRSMSAMSKRDPNSLTRNFIEPGDPTFEHVVLKYTRSPGPVYQIGPIQDRFVLRKNFVATIGNESRDKFFALPTLSPGSPAYSYNPQVQSIHPSSPRTTIGRYKRPNILIRETPVEGPMPNPIEITKIRMKSPRPTIGNAPRGGAKPDPTPGPSDYNSYRWKPYSSTRGTFNRQDRGTSTWIFR